MKRLPIIFFLMLSVISGWSATYTAATVARADVLTAVNQATSPGDKVIIPAGTNTWSASITLTVPIYVEGHGTNQTGGRTMIINSTVGSSGLETPIFNIQLTTHGRIDISKIYFQDQNLDKNSDAIKIPGDSLGGAEVGGIFERAVVIHENFFDSLDFAVVWDGGWGVSYNNTYYNCKNPIRVKGFDHLNLLPVSNPESYKWSSTNYVVVEDETFTYVNWAQDSYLMDTEYPGNYMVRYCTANIGRLRVSGNSFGVDGFDQHGEDGSGDAHVPLGPVIYKNTFNYTGDTTVNPNKFLDMRGGANSLLYSNTVTADDQYVQYRDDQTPSNLTTNNYAWANIDAGNNEFGYDGQDGCTLNVNFFLTGPPAGFGQLTYPHPLRVPDTTFYVDKVNGSDSNPGTEGSPWATIGKANSSLASGQTVYIKAGIYSDPVAPSTSGASGSIISYLRFGTDDVVVSNRTTSCVLSSRSYILVDGIKFKNCDEFLTINAGNNNTVQNCTFGPMRTRSLWAGSAINNGSKFNVVSNCVLHTYGDLSSGDDLSTVLDIGTEEVSNDNTESNLIIDCEFYNGGHHLLGVFGSKNIIKNCYFHHEAWNAGFGNRCIYCAGLNTASSSSAGRNVFDGNRIAWSADPPDDNGAAGVLIAHRNDIWRRNILWKHSLSGMQLSWTSTYYDTPNNNKIYNNTFWSNCLDGATFDPNNNIGNNSAFAVANYIPDSRDATNNLIKNNLFWQNPNVFRFYLTTSNLQVFAGNFEQTSNPQFVSLTGATPANGKTVPNFNLSAGSPCIDTGVALTTITSATGSGTSFVVAESGYFTDGFGITTGDTIRLLGTSTTATISSINYTTHTITTSTSVSWTQGVGVALNYNGSAPDVGALESTPVTVTFPQKSVGRGKIIVPKGSVRIN
jgi:hypothetical protein